MGKKRKYFKLIVSRDSKWRDNRISVNHQYYKELRDMIVVHIYARMNNIKDPVFLKEPIQNLSKTDVAGSVTFGGSMH